MNVEIIDERHQSFNDLVYKKHSSGYYYHDRARHLSLHREVWKFHNGEIPNGCHIHHIDHCKDNNDINNLQMLTNAEHRRSHHQENVTTFRCEYCNKEYIASDTKRNRFCSQGCKQKFYYYNKGIEKVCPICGKTFIASVRDNKATCSRECGRKWRYQKQGNAAIVKICSICGKTFKTIPSQNHQTCSRACGYIFRSHRNKDNQ